MLCVIVSMILASIFAAYLFRRSDSEDEVQVDGKVLVVTGCDSGIGHALALVARRWGCTVVGTCLNPSGVAGNSLRAAGIHAVKVNLTEVNPLNELTLVLDELEAEGNKVWCLVNNAGVMTYAACEWQTEKLISQQIQVNLTGAIQVTSALLPKIRRNRGRIILVSSPTGQVASPNMSVYCASKFGIEGFAQALRREVQCLGVSVSVVRPCNLPSRTGILRSNASRLREMFQNASRETLEDHGDLMEQEVNNFEAVFGSLEEVQDIRDSFLIQCFRSAILSPSPETVYAAAPLVVRLYLSIAQMLPADLVDFCVSRGFHDYVLNFARIA